MISVRITPRQKRLASRQVKHLAWLLLLLVLIVFLVAVLRSQLLKVNRLECRIDYQDCPAEIWGKIFSQVAGKSALSFSSEILAQEIRQNYSYIEEVEVDFSFPDKVIVAMKQRQPLALISLNDKFWLVDCQGIVLGESGPKTGLPEVYLTDSVSTEIRSGVNLNDYSLSGVLAILSGINRLGLDFDYAQVSIADLELVFYAGKQKIIFSLDKEADIQVGSLQLILTRAKIEDKVPELIDLRFEKPVLNY